MKKMFCKLLSILLVLCLCIGLTACGAQSAAGGLGTLTMDDGKSGGIGTLGEPGGADEPSEPGEPTVPAEPDAPAPQEPAPNDGYAAFSSTKQDFSFLYDEGYTAKWSDENGATVYTEHEDSIPYILVFCNHRGDTNGFDISNFFYFKIEEMKTQYGSRLKSVSEVLTLTVGDKKVPGVLFTYTVDTYTIEMFLLLDDTGDSLMQNTAKYVQGGSKDTAEPLSGGIKLEAKGGVRYTVPSIIHPENMPDTLTVRFRVGGIYKNSFISVYFGDQRVQHRKKTVMAPGEMEQVLLKKADLQNIDFNTVTVTVEAE